MSKTVIEHYENHGSAVTISALDFDTVDRYARLNSVSG